MKTYKKIHYWVLALVAIALFVVSAMGVRLGKSSTLDFDRVDNHIARLTEFGEHNYLTPDTQVDAREYILQSLRDMGILENPYEVASDKLDSDFYNSVGYIDNAPTFVLQKAIPNQATNDKILEQDGAVMVDATVDNIVVAFPSASTQAGDISDSVVFAVDYDTQAGHVGASGTNANVAVVLESIKQLAESKQSLQNDVVFLFGESRDQNVGLYLYDNQFDGFKGVANRTSVAIGLHSFGTTGDVALYETSDNNTNLLQNLVLSGTASSSYIQHFFEQSKYKQGTNNFSFDFANYGNFGDTSFARSPQDKMDGVSRATLVSKASLIQKSIDRFGNNKIADLSAGQNGAYAEYLGVGFQIPVIANMIAGGVILALAVLAVILLVRNHGSKEDPKRHMKGKTLRNAIVASVCALLGVGVFALGFYYVFGVWLLVGFGVVPLAGLHTFAMSKPLLLVVLFLLSFAVYNALIGALKRAFNIRSVDVSRANALLLALGAGIAALVVPVLAAPLLLVS
ncbi:MAG: hypothetical protein FWD76_06575, partial [Firmicutes bacterium]|nr:hypothetical protein [Bacillota bacterium]